MINKRNLLVFGAACASIGYLFSIASGSIGLMVFILAWLTNFKNLHFNNLFRNRSYNFLALFFLFLLIGASYSLDIHQAQKEIVRHLSFFLIPFLFITIKPFSKRELGIIFQTFTYSLVIFFAICLINAIHRQIGFFNEGGIFNWYFFYRYDFLEIFSQHPTYISMFTLFSLSVIAFSKQLIFLAKNKPWRTFIIFIHILAILLYGSRMAYIIFCVLVIVYLIQIFKERKIKELLILITLFIFCLFAGWNVPIVKERVLYTLGVNYDYKFNEKEFIKEKSPEEKGRILKWQVAWELVKEKPFLGYGTGSSRKVLVNEYQEKGHSLFYEKKFNAHNTYIEILLIGGIFLLAVYFLILWRILHKAIVKKNLVLFSFFSIIAFTSFTETIFLAQGIIFFAFFYCTLLNKD
jgi:O-antigen ligase